MKILADAKNALSSFGLWLIEDPRRVTLILCLLFLAATAAVVAGVLLPGGTLMAGPSPGGSGGSG